MTKGKEVLKAIAVEMDALLSQGKITEEAAVHLFRAPLLGTFAEEGRDSVLPNWAFGGMAVYKAAEERVLADLVDRIP